MSKIPDVRGDIIAVTDLATAPIHLEPRLDLVHNIDIAARRSVGNAFPEYQRKKPVIAKIREGE